MISLSLPDFMEEENANDMCSIAMTLPMMNYEAVWRGGNGEKRRVPMFR